MIQASTGNTITPTGRHFCNDQISVAYADYIAIYSTSLNPTRALRQAEFVPRHMQKAYKRQHNQQPTQLYSHIKLTNCASQKQCAKSIENRSLKKHS